MVNNEESLDALVSDIQKHTSSYPTLKSIVPFANRLEQIRIEDLIVHAHIHHHGTWLEHLVLSTFTYWRSFGLEDWQSIFKRLAGYDLAEYYMTVTARRCLGIDPGFASAQDIEVTGITFPDMQSQVTSSFYPNLTGRLREIVENTLKEIGISMDDLVVINRSLQRPSKNLQ